MLRSRLKYYFHNIYQRWNYDTQKVLVSLGRLHAAANRHKENVGSLAEVEFQVFSQRGEDGIIQYITDRIAIPNKIFVEFGVENYTESNTRFLLVNNNWSGLIIDGSKDNIRFIKRDYIYWKYDITAVHSFITKDNIDKLIGDYTSVGDIGLLSVDIDGNDYWVWDAISVVNPRVVVVEYNAVFGAQRQVTVPYKEDFVRRRAHHSDLYFGASLNALVQLGNKKGYDFVGVASGGINAFFVRKDLSAPFKKPSVGSAFVPSPNRDSRDEKGNLSFLPFEKRLGVIAALPVYDVEQGATKTIRELYSL